MECWDVIIGFVLNDQKYNITEYNACILYNYYLEFAIKHNLSFNLEVSMEYLRIPKIAGHNSQLRGSIIQDTNDDNKEDHNVDKERDIECSVHFSNLNSWRMEY